MIALRLLLILLILIVRQSLCSQELYFNHPITILPRRSPELKLLHPSPKMDFSLKNSRTLPHNIADTIQIRSLDIYMSRNQSVHPQWIKASIVPLGLIIAGTITLLPESYCMLSKYRIQSEELKLFPEVDTPVDNYLQFVPVVAVFGLKAAGVKSRSDLPNQLAITAKAELLMGLIVHGMKKTIRIERPTGGGMNTMPSGHTAQAFVSATILDMEYRETSPWISIGGYAVATTTAIGRMVNNKHWISDVLIGAGIGIFSAKVVYYTHKYHWVKMNNIVILPAIYKNGGGVTFAMIL